MPDEVHVEVDSDWAQCARTRRSTGGGLVVWGKHLLDTHCQQQHTISLSSAEAELHEVVKCTARGLFIRNVPQAMELKAIVRVGADSSAAAGVTQTLGWRRASATSGGQGTVETRNHQVACNEDQSGSRTTLQTPSIECVWNMARVGKLSGVGSGVLAVASWSFSRQSD